MAIEASDYFLDLTAAADVANFVTAYGAANGVGNPELFPAVLTAINGTKLVSGSMRPTVSDTLSGFRLTAVPDAPVTSSIVISGTVNGDPVGPALLNSAGTGFMLRCSWSDTRVVAITSGVQTGGSLTFTNAAFSDGSLLELSQVEGQIVAEVNGVSVGSISDGGATGLFPAALGRWGNGNQIGIGKFGAMYSAADPKTIDDVNSDETIAVGSTANTATVSNFTGSITGGNLDGVGITNVSHIGSTVTFDLPSFTSGTAYPKVGTACTLTLTSDASETATIDVDLLPHAGFSTETVFASVVTTAASIASTISCPNDSQLWYDISGVTFNADGTYTGTSAGPKTAWHRNETLGIMTLVRFTLSGGEIQRNKTTALSSGTTLLARVIGGMWSVKSTDPLGLETEVGAPVMYVPTYYLPQTTELTWISWDYPAIAHTGIDVDYKMTGYDWYNRPLTWSIVSGPAGMWIDWFGIIHWVPTSEVEQSVTIRVTAGITTVDKTFTISVDNSKCVFVAEDGDDGDAGTINAPYASLYAAFNDITVSGTTGVTPKLVIVRGGSYDIDSISWNGQAPNTPYRKMSQAGWQVDNFPIIRGYPNESATFNFTGTGASGFTFGSSVVVQNLTLNGGNAAENAGLVIYDNGAAKRLTVTNYQSAYTGNCAGVKLGGSFIADMVHAYDNYDRANLTGTTNSSNFLFYGTSGSGDGFAIDCESGFSLQGFKIKHAGEESRIHIHRSVSYSKNPFAGCDNGSSFRHCLALRTATVGDSGGQNCALGLTTTDPTTGGNNNLDEGMLVSDCIIINDDSSDSSAIGQADYAFNTGFATPAAYYRNTVFTANSGIGGGFDTHRYASLTVGWTSVWIDNEFVSPANESNLFRLGSGTNYGISHINTNYGSGNTWGSTRRDLTFQGAGKAWSYDESTGELSSVPLSAGFRYVLNDDFSTNTVGVTRTGWSTGSVYADDQPIATGKSLKINFDAATPPVCGGSHFYGGREDLPVDIPLGKTLWFSMTRYHPSTQTWGYCFGGAGDEAEATGCGKERDGNLWLKDMVLAPDPAISTGRIYIQPSNARRDVALQPGLRAISEVSQSPDDNEEAIYPLDEWFTLQMAVKVADVDDEGFIRVWINDEMVLEDTSANVASNNNFLREFGLGNYWNGVPYTDGVADTHFWIKNIKLASDLSGYGAPTTVDGSGRPYIQPDNIVQELNTFSDSFETGNLTSSSDKFSWDSGGVRTSVVSVSPSKAVLSGFELGGDHTSRDWTNTDGNNALRFTYPANEYWSEQRFYIADGSGQCEFQFDLRVPTDYDHVAQGAGIASNRKIFYIWQDDYSAKGVGSTIGLEMWRLSDISSQLAINIRTQGLGMHTGHTNHVNFINGTTDSGRWMTLNIKLTESTGVDTDDGTVVVSRKWSDEEDFTVIINKTGAVIPNIFGGFQTGYLMGWHNNAYDVDTDWLVDNFTFIHQKSPGYSYAPVLGSGTVYYVSKSGNDTTGDGLTEETAFLTINKAVSILTAGAGETICVMAHNNAITKYYEDTVASPYVSSQVWMDSVFACVGATVSGTISEPVTLMAYPGHEGLVEIDGVDNTRAGIHSNAKDYWQIWGLRIVNCRGGGIVSWGQPENHVPVIDSLSIGWHIENCLVKHVQGAEGVNTSGIAFWGTQDWIIRNVRVTDIDADGSTVSSAMQSYGSINTLIEYCYTDSEMGIYLKDHFISTDSPRTPYEGMEVRFCELKCTHMAIQIGIRGTGSCESGDSYVHHNLMYGFSQGGACIRSIMGGAEGQSTGLRLEHNIVDATGTTGFAAVEAQSLNDLNMKGNTFIGADVNYSVQQGGEGKESILTFSDENVFTTQQWIMNRYPTDGISSTQYRSTYAAWTASTIADTLTLGMDNPDANSLIVASTDMFIDRAGRNYKYGDSSPLTEFMQNGSNAGCYQYGGEVIGLLPTYSAGV